MAATRYCRACARKLREKPVARDGVVEKVLVCKSPVCRLYDRPQT